METSDLTVRVLQEIREEIRATRKDLATNTAVLSERIDAASREASARFEVIEHTLKDLAEQMVMLARGIKSALESRAHVEKRLDDHERRLDDLERDTPH